MQKLDLEQFKKLVTNIGWTHESDIEIIANDDDKTYGFGKVTSRFSGCEITAYEGFVFNGDDISTLDSGFEGFDQSFEFKGFEVFYEYGRLLGRCEVYDMINSNCYADDYNKLEGGIEGFS